MHIELQGNEMFVTVPAIVYNERVVHKCFYWYGNTFNVVIDLANDNFHITLQSKDEGITQDEFKIISEKVKRDLIDFKLRDIVTIETKIIRELLVAKAFAYYDEDESPQTIVTDPVGFDPHVIKIDTDGNDS